MHMWGTRNIPCCKRTLHLTLSITDTAHSLLLYVFHGVGIRYVRTRASRRAVHWRSKRFTDMTLSTTLHCTYDHSYNAISQQLRSNYG